MKIKFQHPRTYICVGFFFLFSMLIFNSSERLFSSESGGKNNYTIRVGVEEVRLDVVVLKRDRRQVTDLTADDFEIYQDDKLQQITSCIYINEDQPKPEADKAASKISKAAPLVGGPMLQREDVRRTFVFLVDNLSFSSENYHFARMGLRNFVENEMRPDDMVSILQTGGGNAALQMFTSDKRILLKKINNLLPVLDTRTLTHVMPEFAAISYFLNALQDMPGRKYMNIITPNVLVPSSMKKAFDGIADAALRAGVVIHMFDINGLTIEAESFEKRRMIRNPLPEKTGGLFIQTNWMVTKSGLSAAQEHVKGYYLLSYIPPVDTYRVDPKGAYRHIKVKVKRPWHEGYDVHTRDGFLALSNPVFTSGENTLKKAIFSPFKNNDLSVDLSSGFFHDPEKGYLLQSWMHLDGKDLSFIEGKDGRHSIKLEAVCITSDMEAIQDSGSGKYEFFIKKENVPWIKEHGLNFSLIVPVKNPGAYYVRAAVKDSESGKIGSAYQFIEIPDLKKRRLALSNIFLTTRDAELPWAQVKTPKTSNLFSPETRRYSRKSPAVRSYLPGENVECAAVIYKAEADKNQKPNLESRLILYSDGKEIFRTGPEAVGISGVSDLSRIPIRRKLLLDHSLQPGDYALQLQVNEIHEKKKDRITKQAVDIKIRKVVLD